MIDALARNWPGNYNVCLTQDVGTITLRDEWHYPDRMLRHPSFKELK